MELVVVGHSRLTLLLERLDRLLAAVSRLIDCTQPEGNALVTIDPSTVHHLHRFDHFLTSLVT